MNRCAAGQGDRRFIGIVSRIEDNDLIALSIGKVRYRVDVDGEVFVLDGELRDAIDAEDALWLQGLIDFDHAAEEEVGESCDDPVS